ncbi:hypothetical protein HKD37_15G043079 [Glycine soja]
MKGNLLDAPIPNSLVHCLKLDILSRNYLSGEIPMQLAINGKLYGPPLNEKLDEKLSRMLPRQECGSVELGFVFGNGIVFGPLLIWKRWRILYW